ncbi:MAG: CoF synthetase [Candidatus Paceibacterota bacterium]
MRRQLKSVGEKVPRSIGRIAARIPYAWRLGAEFKATQHRIQQIEAAAPDARAEQAGLWLKAVVAHHADKSQLYRDHLGEAAQSLGSVNGTDALRRFSSLPVLTKQILQGLLVEQPSSPSNGAMRINTGGTSGNPLSFFVDKNAFAREWAHMHTIWRKLGYHPTSLKLTFRGKNLGKRALRYNAVHNEIHVNPYLPFEVTAKAVAKVAPNIDYLHGYPSSIYEFVRQSTESPSLGDDVLVGFQKRLRGIFYGSEFPAPLYRDFVDDVVGVPSISWYGHSEMCILAYETDRNVYVPMHSYGFTETIPTDDEGEFLIGTSYFNTETPFVRYNTGDLVSSTSANGFVESFQVLQGRVGDFVTDRHGQRISLTALIFGRHHKFFDVGQFVQVRQTEPGKMTLLVVLPENVLTDDLASQFDLSNVAIDCDFEVRSTPVRTPAGKMPLLVD